MKVIIFFWLILFSNVTLSAFETSGLNNVTQIISFSEYGEGDVTVKLTTNTAGCIHGYWLKKTDPGFQTNFNMILASYQTKSKIRISAHTNQLWSGSGGKFCHVYYVRYG